MVIITRWFPTIRWPLLLRRKLKANFSILELAGISRANTNYSDSNLLRGQKEADCWIWEEFLKHQRVVKKSLQTCNKGDLKQNSFFHITHHCTSRQHNGRLLCTSLLFTSEPFQRCCIKFWNWELQIFWFE